MNIITIIASFGVIIGSLALFIILSGFSGLRTFSNTLLNVSDPDIKISAVKGKTFLYTDKIQQVLKKDADIKSFSKVIEERAFLKFKEKEEIAFIKGVDSNYNKITGIDSTLYLGNWLDTDYKNTAVVGYGISYKLSTGVLNLNENLEVYVPKKGKGLLNPANAFNRINLQITGIYSGNEDFVNKFVFVDISKATELLKLKKNELTGIELKLKNNDDASTIAEKLQNKFGTHLKVETRAELNALYFRVMNTENFVVYLIFTLIVIIALFNVIGAIIMMIIDKKRNLKTLFNLGTTLKELKKIFVLQGFLLTLFGMLIGLSIGVALVFLQKQFGWFMITQTLPYPVELQLKNVLIVIVTITVLGFIASKIASSRISKEFIDK
ncbi:ABC transporter permease [Lutibacter sp. Hel_I_33_5]|uniref:ABC transporter permease n=1 Tax=Lutibacter sp. Hel_I_33_5 TaxID=1566289 RepID=UPI00351B9DB1